jgi:ATP-dependent Clp protease adapter protein ClpS
MNILRLAGQMKVDEGKHEMTKFHEEGTSVVVSYHVADDEVVYITSHAYLQNTPKKRTN